MHTTIAPRPSVLLHGHYCTTHGIVLRALDAHCRYGINFYDGLIIAGQDYFGVRVENPFQ